MTERGLRIGGREVRILEEGSGPPVVLVHGLGLTAGVWRPHLDRLAAAGYRAIAPDLPGFGRSGGRRSGLSVPASAAWLLELADAVEAERPGWIGHSVAAEQVVRLAATAPERAAALVLAAPTGRGGRHGIAQLVGLMRTALRERPRLVAGVIRRYLMGPLPTLGTWVRSLSYDAAPDAARVGCPVLIVTGGRDPVVKPEFVRRLVRLLADARTREIPDAAHAVALDPFEPFIEATLGFLEQRYPPGA